MEFAIILLLVLLNGVLAMSEIAIVSARKVRLQQAADRGDARSKAALALAQSPTRFLSTVQVGITLVGTIAGAFGGARIAGDVQEYIKDWPWVGAYAGTVALVAVVVLITYLSLVLGELLPKRLALARPEAIARFMARPMGILSMISSPVVKVLTFSTEALLKPFGLKDEDQAFSEEDIRGLLEQGAKSGVVLEAERELVERVFRVGDQQVRELMVPRNEIVWLDLGATRERITITVATSPHSHFPVCKGSLDRPVGVVHVKDLIKNSLVAEDISLEALARPPLFVPETTQAITMLNRFRRSEQHVALIVDEFGGIEGLITLNDIVEALIGQVQRGGVTDEPEVVERADGSLLLDGRLSISDFRALINVDTLPMEDEADYTTLAGFFIANLGRIPKTGDIFEWQGLKLEVVDMDRQRVDKLLFNRTGRGVQPEEGLGE